MLTISVLTFFQPTSATAQVTVTCPGGADPVMVPVPQPDGSFLDTPQCAAPVANYDVEDPFVKYTVQGADQPYYIYAPGTVPVPADPPGQSPALLQPHMTPEPVDLLWFKQVLEEYQAGAYTATGGGRLEDVVVDLCADMRVPDPECSDTSNTPIDYLLGKIVFALNGITPSTPWLDPRDVPDPANPPPWNGPQLITTAINIVDSAANITGDDFTDLSTVQIALSQESFFQDFGVRPMHPDFGGIDPNKVYTGENLLVNMLGLVAGGAPNPDGSATGDRNALYTIRNAFENGPAGQASRDVLTVIMHFPPIPQKLNGNNPIAEGPDWSQCFGTPNPADVEYVEGNWDRNNPPPDDLFDGLDADYCSFDTTPNLMQALAGITQPYMAMCMLGNYVPETLLNPDPPDRTEGFPPVYSSNLPNGQYRDDNGVLQSVDCTNATWETEGCSIDCGSKQDYCPDPNNPDDCKHNYYEDDNRYLDPNTDDMFTTGCADVSPYESCGAFVGVIDILDAALTTGGSAEYPRQLIANMITGTGGIPESNPPQWGGGYLYESNINGNLLPGAGLPSGGTYIGTDGVFYLTDGMPDAIQDQFRAADDIDAAEDDFSTLEEISGLIVYPSGPDIATNMPSVFPQDWPEGMPTRDPPADQEPGCKDEIGTEGPQMDAYGIENIFSEDSDHSNDMADGFGQDPCAWTRDQVRDDDGNQVLTFATDYEAGIMWDRHFKIWVKEQWLPTLVRFSRQMTAAIIDHTRMLGMAFDAIGVRESAIEIKKAELKQKLEMLPAENACIIGSTPIGTVHARSGSNALRSAFVYDLRRRSGTGKSARLIPGEGVTP